MTDTKGKGKKGKLAVKREAVKSLTDAELDKVSGGLMLQKPGGLPQPIFKNPLGGAIPETLEQVCISPFQIPGGGGISRPTGNPTGSDGCCGG